MSNIDDFDNIAYMDYGDADFQLRKGMRSAEAVYVPPSGACKTSTREKS